MSPTQILVLRAIAASDKPMSYRDIATTLNLAPSTVSAMCSRLLVDEEIHVVDHVRGTDGPACRMFAAGPGESVPRPPRIPAVVRARRSRLRAKKRRTPSLSDVLFAIAHQPAFAVEVFHV